MPATPAAGTRPRPRLPIGGTRSIVPSRSAVRRRPTWSGPLSRSLGGRVPQAWRPQVLTAIRAIHTAVFATIGGSIAVFVWDGIRRRPGRRAAYALGIALGECAIYVSNNQVCPLTPLAEDLGAERGSVVDMYLPDWAARRIPIVGSGALVVGLVLNARVLVRSRAR